MGKIIKNKIEYAGGGSGGADIKVVQTKGQSTTDVMSQKAVTDMVYNQYDYIDIKTDAEEGLFIGHNKNPYYYPADDNMMVGSIIGTVAENKSNTLFVGLNNAGVDDDTFVFGNNIGGNNPRVTTSRGAIGHYSRFSEPGTISFGSNTMHEGKLQNYRLANVADGINNHDAVNVSQLNSAIDEIEVPTVVQNSGQSTTNVMSQKAVTKMIYPNENNFGVGIGGAITTSTQSVAIGGASKCEAWNTVAIGQGAIASGSYGIAIGSYSAAEKGVAIGADAKSKEIGDIAIFGDTTNATTQGNIAIGFNSSVTSAGGSVAIGRDSVADRNNEFSVGSPSRLRVLGNVNNGIKNTDGATVAQGNKLMTTAPRTSDEGVLGQLWTDTRAMHTYQCTAIDNTDPDNPVYTWTQRW